MNMSIAVNPQNFGAHKIKLFHISQTWLNNETIFGQFTILFTMYIINQWHQLTDR